MAHPSQLKEGKHGHLYDGFHVCRWCRFYASNPYVVVAHETRCKGEVPTVCCMSCRFDGVDFDEVRAHHARGDCVGELGAILMPLYMLDYDVLDRAPHECAADHCLMCAMENT